MVDLSILGLTMPASNAAALEWIPAEGILRLYGNWTTSALGGARASLTVLSAEAEQFTIDATNLSGLDTAGALLLCRAIQGLRQTGKRVRVTGLDERREGLLALVEDRIGEESPDTAQSHPRRESGLLLLLGRTAWGWGAHAYAMLSFAGMTFAVLLSCLQRPARLRWRNILAAIQDDGARAVPVLGMLSFLLGVVIAYQAGVQLRLYGGNLYVVDLIAITVLRELGPLMTAIVVAGRSGSAYTAQIGTMQVTEEVDALRSIGVAPMELLVVPKVLGLIVALPLLVMFSNIAAVLGGMVMAATMLDVGFGTFVGRIPEAVSISSLLTGLGKAPVFAVVIVTVGCHQGFQVRGGAESVGRNTTTSVVQAIVLVIVADAAFSVAYSALGI